MEYHEFEVPTGLRQHLQCVWRLQDPSPTTGVAQTIYPDGRCELIVHLATPMAMYELGRGWSAQQPLLFAGQLRSAIKLSAQGPLDCLGIRLRPAASAAIAGRLLPDLRDQVVDLPSLDADFAQRFQRAATGLSSGPGPEPIWDLLEERIGHLPVDARIDQAVASLEADPGGCRVAELAADCGMGLRSFQTRFLASVGLAAKEFARIARLQATLRALDGGTPSLADVAVEAGFSDQSHATREMGRLTGLTPARLSAALNQEPEAETTIRLAAAFVRGDSRPSASG